MRKLSNSKKILILSVTKRCNLRCLYCRPNNNETYDKISFLSDTIDFAKADFNKIKNIWLKNQITEILLTGGEPLEYPYILDLLEFFYDNKITFSIHTNGLSFKWQKVLAFLKNKKLSPKILLSIELVKKLQKQLRGSNIPLELIKKLNDLNCKIELKINLHKQLVKYLPSFAKILKFWLEQGIYSIRFQPIIPIGSKNFIQTISLDKSCIELFAQLIYLKNTKYKKFILNSTKNLYLPIFIIQNKVILNDTILQCCAYQRIILMNTNGELLDCFKLFTKKACITDFDLKCCCFYP